MTIITCAVAITITTTSIALTTIIALSSVAIMVATIVVRMIIMPMLAMLSIIVVVLVAICRMATALTSCQSGRQVYVVGGFDGQEVLNSVEVFDPVESSWSFAVAMNSPRSGVSLVSYNDSLYALGGFDGARRLRSGGT